MREVSSTLTVLLTTAAALVGLLVANPFSAVRAAVIRMANTGPEWALVETYYQDPDTQDTSNGEHPQHSLQTLAAAWSKCADRALLIGNSQMHSVVLAPGEPPATSPEKTYPDFVFEHYRSTGRGPCGYRLSAPNISYMEVLWYLHYLLLDPATQPTTIVLQLNYEEFRKTDVRDSFLELMDRPDFASIMQAESDGGEAYAATFSRALKRRAELHTTRSTMTDGESRDLGGRLEPLSRSLFDRVPGAPRRHRIKGDIVNTLYLLRIHALGITPSSKRAIGGLALTESRRSIERIADLCRAHGIGLRLFNAPQNPAIPLYLDETYERDYQALIQDIAARHGVTLYDFEHAIPAAYWGLSVDGPDPIHLGREGQRRMAETIIGAGVLPTRQ